MSSVALALSGGGAAGFGHVPVLDAFDELEIRPVAIAGASMGALVAAAYASGVSARDIRAHILDLCGDPVRTVRKFVSAAESTWSALSPAIDARAAVRAILPESVPDRIEDLGIPCMIAATDFHARKAACFRSGDLREALAASIAVPGLFSPIRVNGRVYVDAGVTNNLPLDVLPEADLTLGVDAVTEPDSDRTDMPGQVSALVGAMRIMIHQMAQSRLADRPGTTVINPGSSRFGMLEFEKAEEILAAADDARETARRLLIEHLGARPPAASVD